MEIAPQKPPAPSKGIEEGFFKSEGMEGEKMVAKGVMGEKVGASRMDKEDAGTAGSVVGHVYVNLCRGVHRARN